MHAPVTKPMSFSHSPEQVFAAVIRTLEAGKYELASADAGTCRTAFSSGKSADKTLAAMAGNLN